MLQRHAQLSIFDNDETNFSSISQEHKPSSIRTIRPKKLKTFIDLFCGVGGFHVAAKNLGMNCVFASDIDLPAREVYEANFNLIPHGDICSIETSQIPDHDLLCAGFPCQPFSIIGQQKGLNDHRGTLFFEIARIIEAKKPEAFVLENVKQLVSVQNGNVMRMICSSLNELGYEIDYRVLNALDFGLPQKRERVIIVGRRASLGNFNWPTGETRRASLSKVLEKNPDKKHFASPRILQARKAAHKASCRPAIWHQNKGGNVSSHPYSCALRAGASYNYLLVDGERRLTPREMFRLQGFPDSFKLHATDNQSRKQAGNSIPVPMLQAVIKELQNA